MPLTTVALIGASGYLGSHLLTALMRAHGDDKLRLIVLQRASSKVQGLLPSVETRILDADTATLLDYQNALNGVDILISAAAKLSGDASLRFVENLAQIDTLKVYVPSYFTANWTKEEQTNQDNVYLFGKASLKDKTIELGVPTTTIRCGLFESAFLLPAFFGIDALNNTVEVYQGEKGLDQKFSFLSLPFLAEAVAQLIVKPEFGPNQRWTVVEQEFTGRDIVAAFESVHNGEKTKVTELTDATVQQLRAKDAGAGLGAAWRMHWGAGRWNVVNRFDPVGVERRTLLQAVKDAANKK